MTKGAMAELLRRAHGPMAWERGGQKLLSIMNPCKFRAAEYLLRKHEEAGDKVRERERIGGKIESANPNN